MIIESHRNTKPISVFRTSVWNSYFTDKKFFAEIDFQQKQAKSLTREEKESKFLRCVEISLRNENFLLFMKKGVQ